MELKHVKDLMAAMNRHGTKRLSFEKDGVKLELERDCGEAPVAAAPVAMAAPHAVAATHDVHAHNPAPRSAADLPKASPPPSKADESSDESGNWVAAPIVGTFYRSPAPGEDPFVKEGDRVQAGQVICIIEAMKVMNEVKAEEPGVVVKVAVEDGDPVDYGAKLFLIRTS